MSLTAIIWDFDGTLADTRTRNFNVVRRLLTDIGRSPDMMPCLASPDVYDRVNRGYANWRELYVREFGFSEEETDRVGQLWSAYQDRDDTPIDVFHGIADVLDAIAEPAHGIVSQNARDLITRALETADLARHFRHIVGYHDVHIKRQKPEPDGLLACLEQLTGFAPGQALYVGDHETDARCARNAGAALKARGIAVDVLSVAACFADHLDHRDWAVQPDYAARHPRDLLDIVCAIGA
jgi:HAD superfamily hydrolase (TIGR01549 family)